ncbi:MAG: toll/interleukin-1 receptor domain-containing protein [Bacteroidota bacterium]
MLAEFFDDWLPARAPIENVLKSFYFPHDPELLHGASLTVDPVGDGYSKISKSYHQIASLLSSNLDVTQTDINLDMNNQEIKTKPSEYSYDIYISYPRGGMTSKWIQDTFLPLLNHSLGMFLGRSATLFFDYSELSAGDEFPVAIEEALRNSKILIALYTPNYFNSNWCVAEHRTFELKEKEFNSSLIVPIVLHNGQMFPEYARVRQWSDFREYFRLGDTFKLTERYSEFEEKVGELSDAISSLIHKVPELKKNFKVIKPSDVKIKRIDGPPLL